MAISFVSKLDFQNVTGTSATVAFDCTGSDFLIVNVTSTDSSEGQISGITYAGISMVRVLSQQDTTSLIWLQTYVLKAPATGSNNIIVSRGVSGAIQFCAACYKGVSQVNAADATGVLHVTGSGSQTVSITTVANNCWLFMTKWDDTVNATATVNCTERTNTGTPFVDDTSVYDSNAAKSPAGIYTIGLSYPSANNGLIIAMSLAPAGAGNSFIPNLLLMGVG